jgi:hypothetical protein
MPTAKRRKISIAAIAHRQGDLLLQFQYETESAIPNLYAQSIRPMKILTLFLLSVALSSATTIHFESLSTTFASSYTESGVTFTAITGAGLRGQTSSNGSIGIAGYASPFSLIKASIAGGAKFVSVGLGDIGSDSDNLVLSIYDSSDNLLGSTSLLIPSSNALLNTLSLNSATDIAYAIFGSTAPSVSGSSIIGDEFTYLNESPVPEPASLLLSLTALGLLAGYRRASSN